MKIVHVITRLIVGGAQENTILTCRGLAEKGHDVTLVSGAETGPEGSLWSQTRGAGFETIVLDSLRRAVRPWHDLRARSALERIFARLCPQVVHTHSSKAGILGRSAARGVPVVVHTIHGMSFNRTQGAPTRAAYRWLERRAARGTTAFITVADAMIDQAVAAGIAPRERFTTVRSGLVTENYASDPRRRNARRAEWGIADGDVVVGTIARLFDNKGYDEIIAMMPRAVAGFPRLRFVWVGDGRRKEQYAQGLARIGLQDRVRMVGLVDPGEVPGIVDGFDVLLHASRWEGLPRAIVQGLLMGVPAVSFDNDGAPEVVHTGETGILVPSGDIDGLADGIVRLARDPELRRRVGARGREECLGRFDWKKMVDQIEALYRRYIDLGVKNAT